MNTKFKMEPEGDKFRIYALKNIGKDISKGEKGGLIEYEFNLSQNGDCWIYEDAAVYGNATVSQNAQIFSRARVFGDATVSGDALVYGDVRVFENAKVYGHTEVFGDASIYGNARILENAHVGDNAKIYEDALVYGNALIYGNAEIYGKSKVLDNVQVYCNAKIFGDLSLRGSPRIIFNVIDCNYMVFKYKQHEAYYWETLKILQIGCEIHNIDIWQIRYEDIGRSHHYSIKDVKIYGEFIKMCGMMARGEFDCEKV